MEGGREQSRSLLRLPAIVVLLACLHGGQGRPPYWTCECAGGNRVAQASRFVIGRLSEPPSFFFKRNFWATFEDDRPGLLTRHLLNLDHLMWGSDYPHSEGTFPYSRKKIAADFADLPAEETRRLVRDNALSLYRLDV